MTSLKILFSLSLPVADTVTDSSFSMYGSHPLYKDGKYEES